METRGKKGKEVSIEKFLYARALVQGKLTTKKDAAKQLGISLYMYRKYDKAYENITLEDLKIRR